MRITRKGYYTVDGPDGLPLLNESGTIRRVTSRDEAYERILSDGRGGKFVLHCPDREVRVIGSVADQGAGDTEAPSIPTGLTATAINKNQIDLLWQASTDNVAVTGYQIFRGGTPLDTVTAPTVSYSDTSVSPSTLYSYTVAAYDAAGNTSAESGADTATTPANTAPTWTPIPDQEWIVGNAVNIDLDDYADDVDVELLTYTLVAPFDTLPDGIKLENGVISGTPTTAGESRTIQVRADDGNDTADDSFLAETFSADVTAPPVPTGLASTNETNSTISMSWNASTDVIGAANEYVSGTASYKLYRDGGLVVTQAGTTYTDTGLSTGTQFSYTVSAVDVAGNESAQSSAVLVSTTSAPNLEADWQSRINQPGVIWYHNFASAGEVDAFRWSNGYGSGNDPTDAVAAPRLNNSVERITTDGITGGGCLEIIRASGTGESKDWWRPMAPLDSGSGKPGNDPGANGRIAVKSWAPTDGGNQTAAWSGNFWGHPDYHAASPGEFDGHGYWVQARVKLDPLRTDQEPDGGKVFYFTRTDLSLTSQEIVVMSRQNANISGNPHNFFDMYRSGSPPLRSDDPGNDAQPGTEKAGSCQFAFDNTIIGGCWTWNMGEWDTLLFHIVPGLNSNNDTVVEVYAAHPGDTAYTRIWNQRNVDLPYSVTEGHNALICSIYTNGANMSTGFYQRFDEIIMSIDPIALPLTAPTALQTAADGLAAGQFTDFTVHTGASAEDTQWMTECVYYDVIHRKIQWMGKDAGAGSPHTHYVYDEITDTYSTSGDAPAAGSGHIWNKCFDPIEGDYYFRQSNTNYMHRWDRLSGAWTTTATQTSPALNSGNADFAAMGYHPNLFGPGQPGILCWAVFRPFAYNPRTDTWSVLATSNFSSGTPYLDRRQGDAFYFYDTDQLVIYAGQGGASSDAAIVVEAGAGLSSNIITDGYVSTTTSPPLTIQGLGGTAQQGIIIKHPSNPEVLLCLEEHGTARVWRSDDYGVSWQLQGYTHPFDGNASPVMPSNSGETGGFCAGTISTHKVAIGLTTNGSGAHPRLWRPNS